MSGSLQKTSIVCLVEPSAFFANPDTQDNHFQYRADGGRSQEISDRAITEHKNLRASLVQAGVPVLVLKGPEGRPDAIFPNNSFSIHERGGEFLAILYPMSPGRRRELPESFVSFLKGLAGKNFHDLRHFEASGKYLEGTGVLNFTDAEDAVFMGRSERADEEVFHIASEILGIPRAARFVFDMFDAKGRKVYHTNVINWIGEKLFAVCLESIPDGPEKAAMLAYVAQKGLALLDLSFAEIDAFSGNALEVSDMDGNRWLTVSKTGYDNLAAANRTAVDAYYQGRVVAADVETVQKYGGGSVRCMEAKASLPRFLIDTLLRNAKTALGPDLTELKAPFLY